MSETQVRLRQNPLALIRENNAHVPETNNRMFSQEHVIDWFGSTAQRRAGSLGFLGYCFLRPRPLHY